MRMTYYTKIRNACMVLFVAACTPTYEEVVFDTGDEFLDDLSLRTYNTDLIPSAKLDSFNRLASEALGDRTFRVTSIEKPVEALMEIDGPQKWFLVAGTIMIDEVGSRCFAYYDIQFIGSKQPGILLFIADENKCEDLMEVKEPEFFASSSSAS